MAFGAVLDACVLYPFSLRDILLRLAELELYDAFWSARILREMVRNLVQNDVMSREKADRLVDLMQRALDNAEVAEPVVAQLEPVMTNHPKDRHVLATAVAAHAEVVITHNLRDFPVHACQPLGIEAVHPDDFLLVLQSKHPAVVLKALQEQSADLHNPPLTLDELLRSLEKDVPRFVQAVGIRAGLT